MWFDLYKYAMAATTAALLLLWVFQPQWGAFELFVLTVFALPLYIPLLYRFASVIRVARKQRRLGLPPARDRDIIDFVGEDLDRVDVPWQRHVALRRTSNWTTLEVGEDDEDPVRSACIRASSLSRARGPTRPPLSTRSRRSMIFCCAIKGVCGSTVTSSSNPKRRFEPARQLRRRNSLPAPFRRIKALQASNRGAYNRTHREMTGDG